MLSFLQSLLYLCVEHIEKVYCIYDDCNIEGILWDRERISVVPITYKSKMY